MKHSLVIAAALAVLLAACGKEEQPAVPAAPAEQAAPAAEAPAVVGSPATEAPATEPAAPAPAEGATAPSSQAPATAPTQGQSGALDIETGMALAKSSGCLACHQIEAKRVGPTWMDVSKKYHGNADAKTILVAQIKKGGVAGWQMGVMPPYSSSVPDADIEKLADFILALNKG